jgi:hypothetical protein
MPTPELLLACGCRIVFEDDKAPICRLHGNQPVRRVVNMPKPTIRGVATGPLVRTEDLPAYSGPLTRG